MNMRLRYVLLDPTGNYTVLVRSSVPIAQQPAVAARLMQAEPLAEQVGFLSDGGNVCLRMAGGEFCGNAAMSAAVLRAADTGQTDAEFPVDFLQAGTQVRVRVHENASDCYTGTVEMPQPISVELCDLPDGGQLPVVRFDGIAHVIVQTPMEKTRAQSLAPVWCDALHAQAVGLMLFDRANDRLAPLVYVPSADTLCWENSCASGTTAVGYFLARETNELPETEIRQPGGKLHIAVQQNGAVRLTGSVKIVRQREIEL